VDINVFIKLILVLRQFFKAPHFILSCTLQNDSALAGHKMHCLSGVCSPGFKFTHNVFIDLFRLYTLIVACGVVHKSTQVEKLLGC